MGGRRQNLPSLKYPIKIPHSPLSYNIYETPDSRPHEESRFSHICYKLTDQIQIGYNLSNSKLYSHIKICENIWNIIVFMHVQVIFTRLIFVKNGTVKSWAKVFHKCIDEVEKESVKKSTKKFNIKTCNLSTDSR